MGIIDIDYNKRENSTKYLYTEDRYKSFNSNLLGLKKPDPSRSLTEALVAIFDLAEFTRFCDRSDPHLDVRNFLDEFMEWVFTEVKEGLKENYVSRNELELLAPLPLFCKFTGDGILFLWDLQTKYLHDLSRCSYMACHIIQILRNVCEAYLWDFLLKISPEIPNDPPIPAKLRCGVARGQAVYLTHWDDFVGPCLNTASRLSKKRMLSFAIDAKGIHIINDMNSVTRRDYYKVEINIDGIGNKYIWILGHEYEKLPEIGKQEFQIIEKIKSEDKLPQKIRP